MGQGSNTLAKAVATLGHAAAKAVPLATADALSPRRPASASAEELVPGVPQTHQGPACLPEAARECQREDVFLRGEQRPPASRHQARYFTGTSASGLGDGLIATRVGLAFCLFSLILKVEHSQSIVKKKNWDK